MRRRRHMQAGRRRQAEPAQGKRANQKWDVAVSFFWWEEVWGGLSNRSLAGPIRGEAAREMQKVGVEGLEEDLGLCLKTGMTES